MARQLSYNSDIGRYTGTDSEGTYIEIDEDAFAEARQGREKDGMSYDQAMRETEDPDGWEPDFDGYIPPADHLGNRGWGGARPNSGPKPMPEDQKRVVRNVRLSPDADRIVRAYQATHGSENYTAALEAIIRSPHQRQKAPRRSM